MCPILAQTVIYKGEKMKKYDIRIVDMVKKYTFHKKSCSLGTVDEDEGDFCSCNITGRRKALADEITRLIDEAKINHKEV